VILEVAIYSKKKKKKKKKHNQYSSSLNRNDGSLTHPIAPWCSSLVVRFEDLSSIFFRAIKRSSLPHLLLRLHHWRYYKSSSWILPRLHVYVYLLNSKVKRYQTAVQFFFIDRDQIKLGAIYKRCPHKIAKIWLPLLTLSTALPQVPQPFHLVRTHHNFRKMFRLLQQKYRTPALRILSTIFLRCPQNEPPWLRTVFMDSPLETAPSLRRTAGRM